MRDQNAVPCNTRNTKAGPGINLIETTTPARPADVMKKLLTSVMRSLKSSSDFNLFMYRIALDE